jgi:hypothetical protein
MANQKFKTKVQADAGISLPLESASKALQIDPSGNVQSSTITTTELGYLSGVTSAIQTQLGNKADGSALTDHINDMSDAHAASAITNTPAGNLAATTVQAALDELQSDIDSRALASALSDHISDVTDAHDASAISNVAAGNLAATDVQSALNELQSDIDSRALDSAVVKKDGSVAFTADQSMGNFKLTSVAAPSSSSDAANKGYVDAVAEGLRPKEAVRVATTANIDLTEDLENGDSIDGVALVTGDRVLVKSQTDESENGIYIVPASGAASRSTDFDSLSPIDEINGSMVAVQEGTANAGKVFVQSGVVATLNTDDITFVFFNSSASLVGGDGVTVSGSNISVDHDGEGLQFSTNQLALELDGSTLSKSSSGLKLSDTAVTPATYGTSNDVAQFTVDQQGRITSASDVAIDHDALLNFVSNEHIDHSSVSIETTANSGLAGGGNITATRSLSVDVTNLTAETSVANADLVVIYDDSATTHRKMTRANFLSGVTLSSPGDINESTFALTNDQSTVADVTGLAFNNAVVRSFEALVTIVIDATADLYETYKLVGIQKGASWDMAPSSVGDDSLVTFSITNAGQIQYTSADYAGFVSGEISYRAITLSI